MLEYLEQSRIKAELSKKDSYKIQNDWLHTFCQNVKIKTGKWVHNGFMWHAFSYNFVATIERDQAIKAYLSQIPTDVILLPEIDSSPTIVYEGIPDIKIRSCLEDFYIFPKNFAWSIAFTHEDGVGPYFVKK